MAYVMQRDGSRRPVKNLGWLLRHNADVRSFTVHVPAVGATGPGPRSTQDATLKAYLDDGRVYVANFASRRVLAGWLDRPVFRGIHVIWDRGGRDTQGMDVGSDKYKRLEEYEEYR